MQSREIILISRYTIVNDCIQHYVPTSQTCTDSCTRQISLRLEGRRRNHRGQNTKPGDSLQRPTLTSLPSPAICTSGGFLENPAAQGSKPPDHRIQQGSWGTKLSRKIKGFPMFKQSSGGKKKNPYTVPILTTKSTPQTSMFPSSGTGGSHICQMSALRVPIYVRCGLQNATIKLFGRVTSGRRKSTGRHREEHSKRNRKSSGNSSGIFYHKTPRLKA